MNMKGKGEKIPLSFSLIIRYNKMDYEKNTKRSVRDGT